MTSTTDSLRPDGILQHDGMLWKPRHSTTVTADEFIAARTTFQEIAADMRWNPWVRDDRAAEWEHAIQMMDEWQRAEPGHRYLTEAEIEAQGKRSDARLHAERDAREQRFARDKNNYSPDREGARLRLLELHSRLKHDRAELVGLREKTSFPAMTEERRAEKIAALADTVEEMERDVAAFAATAGDLETVVDEYGRRPQDRRELSWQVYAARRATRVRELRTQLPDLQTQLAAADSKEQRATCRRALDTATAELEQLLAVPSLIADDMCSECPTPMSRHGWTSSREVSGPCAAWPQWGAKIRGILQMMEQWAQREQPTAPPAPTPQPLAVIPSGLPIGEIITKLEQLKQDYPDAEVRRGRASRWELWPRKQLPDA